MIGPIVHLLIVLIFAGLVHLSTVLAMPWLATRDGYWRIMQMAPDNQMALLTPAQVQASLPFSDPATVTAACRYVLDNGPVRIRVVATQMPVSVVLLRKGAGIFHSVSDKAATQGVLEVVVATPAQMDQIIELDVDDEPVQEIRVVSPQETGLALVRGLAAVPSTRPGLEAAIAQATCEAERLEE